jgi:hypothetical protein
VRISDAGELKTTNTPEQIMEAITFLTAAMLEANNTNQ